MALARQLTPLVDARQPADQRLIDNWASEYFRKADVSYVADLLGVNANQLKFNYQEYQAVANSLTGAVAAGPQAGVPDPESLAFYQAALTLDRLLNHMRVCDNMIGKLNTSNLQKSLAFLRRNLPTPDWVPIPDDPASIVLRTLVVAPFNSVRVSGSDTGRLGYICTFPVTHAMLAISQGSALVDPAAGPGNWTAGNWGCTAAYHIGNDLNAGNRTIAGGVVGFGTVQAGPAAGGPAPVFGATAAVNPANANGGVLDAIPAVGGAAADVLTRLELMNSFKRSGALASIYSMFNKLMKHYEQELGRNGIEWQQTGPGMIQNLRSGPLLGANFQCGPGMQPMFYNAAGAPLAPREAIQKVGNKFFLTSAVDPSRSGCRAAIEATFGARRRRVVYRRPVGRPRLHAMTVNPQDYAARRRVVHRRPAVRRRPVARASVQPSLAMTIDPRQYAARSCSMEARRRRVVHRRPVARRPLYAARKTRRAPWDDMFGDQILDSIDPSVDDTQSIIRPAMAARRRAVVRRRRPARAMVVDPSLFAALEIKEAMMARRRRSTAAKRKPAARRQTTFGFY